VKILHLCSAFAKSKLYTDFCQHLCDLGVDQVVFAPVRTVNELTKQPSGKRALLDIRVHYILRPWDRVFFSNKVAKVYAKVLEEISVREIDCAHAHFLYSDGAVAMRLKRDFGIPFVVAVRNTDVNYFMRFRPDLWGVAQKVLIEAERIVFISPSYRKAFLDFKLGPIRSLVEAKSVVLPNGVARFWLDSVPESLGGLKGKNEALRLLYVGDFTSNKNTLGTLRAAALVQKTRPVKVTLVGSSGPDEARVNNLLGSSKYSFAARVGRIHERAELLKVYREHDIFVMPSFRETFGLVYVEALSQGLPVVHSAGQGIDGYFDASGVAIGVDPGSPRDIARGIEALATEISSRRGECVIQARRFDWRLICAEYLEIYRGCVRSHGIQSEA